MYQSHVKKLERSYIIKIYYLAGIEECRKTHLISRHFKHSLPGFYRRLPHLSCFFWCKLWRVCGGMYFDLLDPCGREVSSGKSCLARKSWGEMIVLLKVLGLGRKFP